MVAVGLWMKRLVVGLAVGRFLSPVVAQSDAGSTLLTQQTSVLSTVMSVATSASSTLLLSTSGSVVVTITAPSPSATPSNDTTTGPKEHFIKVGAGGFQLEPDSISNVSVGDTVTFEFFPTGHSIVRAEYGSACVPYEYLGGNRTGFYSGPMMVDSVSKTKFWSILINSTEPIFYYCGADTSCDQHLMVGAINPNETQTLSAQKLAANNADWKLIPGDPIPEEGRSSLTIPLTMTATATATVTAAPTVQPDDGGLSGGAIAGIVVGAVAFLIICAALFFYVGRLRSLTEIMKRQDATTTRGSANLEMGQSPLGPGSPGLHAPYGPPIAGQTNYAGNQLPAYGQHNATDERAGVWIRPSVDPRHMSMGSTVYDGMSQREIDEMKQQQALQGTRVELLSPTPGQGDWAHELEAPRGQK